MRGLLRRLWSDERGAALALIAVSLVAIVSIGALTIDAGLLYTAHDEAQRAADASALAGVSAYVGVNYDDPAGTAIVGDAKHRAKLFAQKNDLRSIRIDTTYLATYNGILRDSTQEVVVQVIPASSETGRPRVRVTVRRRGIGLLFANLFGVGRAGVTATAVAEATTAGSATCLAPVALPDIWDEKDGDTNGDHLWQQGENWAYSASTDIYRQFDGPGTTEETGYGADLRNESGSPLYTKDRGRKLVIKPQRPPTGNNQNNTWVPQTSPGWFFPWQIGTCSNCGGGNNYRQNWSQCNPRTVTLGQPQELEMGNMVGPTKQGVGDLMDKDPDAQWVEEQNGGPGYVTGSKFAVWEQSPRVIKVALYNPAMLDSIKANLNTTNASHTIKFNNFALLWLDGLVCDDGSNGCNDPNVVARFMYYASGNGGGPTLGPLSAYVRLVQ